MNAQVGWLLTRDRQDSDAHDHPCGVRERLPALPVSFDRRETDGVEPLENIGPGLADPLRRNLAGGAGCSHGALLSAKDSVSLPQHTPLGKFRDPSGK
jgi:hypothetical protein